MHKLDFLYQQHVIYNNIDVLISVWWFVALTIILSSRLF